MNHIEPELGTTPLHDGAWRNTNPDIIPVLLEAGADIGAVDDLGRSPLHMVALGNEGSSEGLFVGLR